MKLPHSWLLPAPSGAWPVGPHDDLLKAAILDDDARALAHAERWLAGNDLDAASFRDHRLLVAILARHGRKLESSAYYPRLAGLQRMLWTRTLIFLREARPALLAIAGRGISIMLIKGAARLCDGGAGKSGRVAHDLDIVVVPPETRTAFEVLADSGWTPSSGASIARIGRELESMRALNMYKGRYGDIDLHAHAFHPGQGGAEDERALWDDARPAELDGIPVVLPSPEDRIALSIAHGGLDAHNHSDWLVDIGAIIRDAPVSFDRLEDIVGRRDIVVPAAIALGYLAHDCDVQVDDAMLGRLAACAQARPVHYLSGFLQARPRDREGRLGAVLRGAAKHARMKRVKEKLPRPPGGEMAIRRVRGGSRIDDSLPLMTNRQAELGDSRGRMRLTARLVLPMPPVARRFDFEINSDVGHIGHASYRVLRANGRGLCLVIDCRFERPEGAKTLTLEARPRRAERVINTEEEHMRYDAVPFQIVDWTLEAENGA